jgi:hypothetical protein
VTLVVGELEIGDDRAVLVRPARLSQVHAYQISTSTSSGQLRVCLHPSALPAQSHAIHQGRCRGDRLHMPTSSVSPVGLPRWWLNEQASVYISGKEDAGRRRIFDHPGLRVMAASPAHVFAMKARAARTRDIDDLRLLAEPQIAAHYMLINARTSHSVHGVAFPSADFRAATSAPLCLDWVLLLPGVLPGLRSFFQGRYRRWTWPG